MPPDAANAEVGVHLLTCEKGFFQTIFADSFPNETHLVRLAAIQASGILAHEQHVGGGATFSAPDDSAPDENATTTTTPSFLPTTTTNVAPAAAPVDHSNTTSGDAESEIESAERDSLMSDSEHLTVSYLTAAHKEAETRILPVSFPGLLDILEALRECGAVLLASKTSYWTHIKGDPKRLMFNLDTFQATNSSAEGKAMTLAQLVCNQLRGWHSELFATHDILEPALHCYCCLVAPAPECKQEELECQQFHKDSEYDGTINLLIALEDAYFTDFLVDGQIKRLAMKRGEGVYFTSSYHRGTDAMGLRLHIRIESHSRGRGKEKDLGAPLTFLMVDKEANLLERTLVSPLDLQPVVIGCKTSFDNNQGHIVFTNDEVRADIPLTYLKNKAKKYGLSVQSLVSALMDNTFGYIDVLPLRLSSVLEEDASAWAPSGLCGLIGIYNCVRFIGNTNASGLMPVEKWQEYRHVANFTDTNEMLLFVEECFENLDIYRRIITDQTDLESAVSKLHRIKEKAQLVASVESYLAPEEVITILASLLRGYPLCNIFIWVGADGSYRLRSYIAGGGTLYNGSAVSMSLYKVSTYILRTYYIHTYSLIIIIIFRKGINGEEYGGIDPHWTLR